MGVWVAVACGGGNVSEADVAGAGAEAQRREEGSHGSPWGSRTIDDTHNKTS